MYRKVKADLTFNHPRCREQNTFAGQLPDGFR